MRIYAVSTMVLNGTDQSMHRADAILANSIADAEARALAIAEQKLPPERGWTAYDSCAIEVPSGWIRDSAAELRSPRRAWGRF